MGSLIGIVQIKHHPEAVITGDDDFVINLAGCVNHGGRDSQCP